jgi:hypothetical protein
MLSRIYRKLGPAGFGLAVVALIAALAGSAVAAAGLTATQKREVKKIAKKFAGKPGPAGPAGPEGPAGKNGADGKNGSNGKSVITGNEPTGTTHCEELGGAWVEVEGSGQKRYACNGDSGAAAGGTQTGDWGFVDKGQLSNFVVISYPRRLETLPTFEWVGPGTAPGTNPNCPGNPAEPAAEPGYLCVYASQVVSAGEGTDQHPKSPSSGASTAFASYTADPKSGITMEFAIESESAEAFGYGSWAVTE